jgi:hypothetical protein
MTTAFKKYSLHGITDLRCLSDFLLSGAHKRIYLQQEKAKMKAQLKETI